MATRRDLLKTMGLAAGGMLGGVASRGAAQNNFSWGRVRFGTQTNAYPIDPSSFDTFLGALGKIKAIGFEGFETGYRNVMPQFASPAEARAKIAETGLTFFGIHIYLGPGRYDAQTLIAPSALYEPVVQGGKALGARTLICSGEAATNAQQLKAKVAGLNAAGRYSKSQGMGFAYHNEEPESHSAVGELEVLCSDTDPALVRLLLDVGHLYNVGGDPVAFLSRHSERIAALHLRDYRDQQQVVLGSGTLPLVAIARTLQALHWQGWAETEEERLDGVKHGDEYLRPAYGAMHAAFAA